MPAKYTTRIAWPSQEEIEEAKAKAKARKVSLSKLIRNLIRRLK